MAGSADAVFWEAEQLAWRLPEQIAVSAWADTHRVLTKASARPGKWRTSVAPYLEEMMNAACDPYVRRVTFMTSTQVGKTEALINVLLFFLEQDPSPCLWVIPRTEDTDEHGDRIKEAIEASPAVSKHLTGWATDWKKALVKLANGARLRLVTAGSPAALASLARKLVIFDELDKAPSKAGKEASPLKLVGERLRTWRDSKMLVASTPTTRHGAVFQSWELSSKERYFMPCPRCAAFIRFEWANVQYGEERDPEKYRQPENAHLAWYECPECDARIDDVHKPAMLRKGRWVPEGCTIDGTGRVHGKPRAKTHRGFHVWAAYSPWLTFAELVAEFLETRHDPNEFLNTVNSWWGDIWEEKDAETSEATILRRADKRKEGQVPDGTVMLTAGVDFQGSSPHFRYVVRAWGPGLESWLVRYGALDTWPEIKQLLLEERFDGWPIDLTCFDASYKPDPVYDFCRQFPQRVRPVQGDDAVRGVPYQVSKIDRHPTTGQLIPYSFALWRLNTRYFKDKLHDHIHRAPDEDGQWHVHDEPPPNYVREMVSEQRVLDRTGTKLVERWVLKPGYRRNEAWDCEYMALAAACMRGLFNVRTEKQAAGYEAARAQHPRQQRKRRRRSSGRGWIERRGEW